MNTAATTGANAALNNYLNHVRPSLLALSEKEQFEQAAQQCGPGNRAACQTASALRELSRTRNEQLRQACASGPTQQCATLINQAQDMGNRVFADGNFVWAHSPDRGFALNISTIGNSPSSQDRARNNSFHHRQARNLSQGLVLGALAATPGAAYTLGPRVVQGAQAGTRATINAMRAEAQLLQFGYYRYVVPTTTSGMIWISNPINVQNTTDFVQGLFPGPPPPPPASE